MDTARRDSKETALHHSNHTSRVINVKAIKKENLPYILVWILYYAGVVVFTTWWTASFEIASAFSLELRSLIQIINMFSSVVCAFFFRKEWFVATARTGAVIVAAMLGLFLLAPTPQVKILAAVLLGVALGCVNISILIPFTFVLNNTEKFYAVLLSHTLANMIPLITGSNMNGWIEVCLTLFIFIVSLTAVFFFKRQHLPPAGDDQLPIHKNARPAMFLTITISTIGAVLFLGAGKTALNIYANVFENIVISWYYIGGIIGCLIYLLIFTFLNRNIELTLGMPFACLAIGLLCNAFADKAPEMEAAFGCLLGVGTSMGMSAVYYTLGVVGKKYYSMRYLRFSILIIGIFGGVTAVLIGNGFSAANNMQISIIISVASSVAVVFVLLFSPLIARICFDKNWARDSALIDVTSLEKIVNTVNTTDTGKSENSIFTPQELDIALLLIEGETQRQISRKLHLTAGEVNHHINTIREKIGVQSEPNISVIVMKFKLTRRETDMLNCLRKGMTNNVIADELFLSEATVKNHVHSLMQKLPVDSRQEIPAWVEAFAEITK